MKILRNNKLVTVEAGKPYRKRNTTDSEEFILQIGKRVKKALPHMFEDGYNGKFTIRQGVQLGSSVLTSMMVGNDKYDMGSVPFDLLFSEFKRLNKLYPDA